MNIVPGPIDGKKARENVKTGYSACPHDCPSTCALEVELLSGTQIGRVRGSKDNEYTAGVVCEKVARYGEHVHHPDRVLHALRRKGDKGAGDWQQISVKDALDEVAEAFLKAEQTYGPEAVWPYYYAGTMGLVMRDGINRLRHVKNYSGMYKSFCTALSQPGYMAGTGRLTGTDPREIAKSDFIIVWGGNPVHTQVNLMTHITRARKGRGAKFAVVDVYETATMKQADLGLIIRPGTDGALACAVMHILFRDGTADRVYMAKYTDAPAELEAHLKSKTPEWASAITGLEVSMIEQFAKLIGTTQRSFFRIGYGFTRQRNGSVNMHAVTSIAAVAGCWQYEGGGAMYSNGDVYKINNSMIEAPEMRSPGVRVLDQCRIGAVLNHNPVDLGDGPPVTAMLVQNTNPASVAPDQTQVKKGLARDDLFLCVHEQFMTETAAFADIILPATMFLEHDDIYQGGGHQNLIAGPALIEAPGACVNNHEVICALARRVGAQHPAFDMTAAELIDWTLENSGLGSFANIKSERWIDHQPDFETAHFLNGFGHTDGKYHFRPDWQAQSSQKTVNGLVPADDIPSLPDHWPVIEEADDEHPFRLTTSPARGFLNTTFNKTPTSLAREGRPEVMVHRDDLKRLGLKTGDKVRLGNSRGTVILHAVACDGIRPGVLVSESIWPNNAFEGGNGINTLTGSDQPAPCGGGAFHDIKVWLARP